MAPGKRARVIKLRAPRQNAQRIGTKLGTEIKNLGRAKRIRVEIYQPGQEVAQAVVRSVDEHLFVLNTTPAIGKRFGMELSFDYCAGRQGTSVGRRNTTVNVIFSVSSRSLPNR